MIMSIGSEKRRKSLQLLTRNEDFINEIKEFRLKYGIPRDGFQYKEKITANVNHKIVVKSLAEKYAKKDIDRIQKRYRRYIGANRELLVNLLLFKYFGLSKYNFDIQTSNIPSELKEVIKGAENLKPEGRVRMFLSINGTTKYKDVSSVFEEVILPRREFLSKNKEPFRVIRKKGEVLIEVFKNTRGSHFTKKSWDELVLPKQQKLPDFDPTPFRKFVNNERDRIIVEALRNGNASKIFKEVSQKEAREEDLIESEKKILETNDYSHLYKIKARYKKREK